MPRRLSVRLYTRTEDLSTDDMPMMTQIAGCIRGNTQTTRDIVQTILLTRPGVLSRRRPPRAQPAGIAIYQGELCKKVWCLPFVLPAIYICPNLSAFISASLCLHPSRGETRRERGGNKYTGIRLIVLTERDEAAREETDEIDIAP